MPGRRVYTALAFPTHCRPCCRGSKAIKTIYSSQFSPKAKLCPYCWKGSCGYERAQESASCVLFFFLFFSAVCPEGTAGECYCFLRCRFCHRCLVGLGAFLRLPTDLRENAAAACVGVGCVGAHICDRVQHPHVKKNVYLSQQYMFLAFSLSPPTPPGAVVGICSSLMVDQKRTVLQLSARIIRFVLPCVVTQEMM